MRKTLMVLSATALLIGVAGCTSSPESVTEPGPVEVETEETTAPLAAEPIEEATSDDPETAYLEHMRARIGAERPAIEATQIASATDQQLLDAAKDACEQLESGTKMGEVRVVKGEEPNQMGSFIDSRDITSAAVEFFCPGYTP